MDTFELLPTLAQGELGETSAPELVAAVFRSRASGTLWLETPGGVEIRVFFRAGDMCGTALFEGFHTLAHVLLANDWVNALDIDSSREEAAATKRRHGEVLVARRLLTEAQLRSALKAQHTSNLNRVLSLTEGKYDWRGWEPPPPWSREVQVDPVASLVLALEQDQHSARRQKIMRWLGSSAARLSLEWQDLQSRIALDPLDRRAAAVLAQPRTAADFMQRSKLPQIRAEALLAALLLAGAAEPADADAGAVVQVEEPEPETVDPLPRDAPENCVEEQLPELELLESDDAPPPLRKKATTADARRRPVDEQEAIARLESFELDEDATPTSPQPTEPHDDDELEIAPSAGRSIRGRPPSAGAAPASDAEAARELRKKMLARGLRNLGTLPVPPRQDPASEGSDSTGDAPQREAPAARTGELSPEDRLFADEVRARVARAPRQSAYVRLGIAEGATSDQIKAAYLHAAKRFHPDRAAAPGLASLQADLERLFAMLKDAYESIATPEARRSQQHGGAAATKSAAVRAEEAHTALKMGEVLLKKRDFPGALEKLRRAADLDPNGDSLAALAWGLVRDPKCSPQARDEAAALINRALRANGVTARTYYVAGVLWRKADPDSAADAFRKALQMDPHHSDASLELRLIEQRRGKQKESGGVLSGLFGKRKG